MTTFRVQLATCWHRSKSILFLLLLMTTFAGYFVTRYSIAYNDANSDCLRARLFLIDKWDTQVSQNDVVAFHMQIDNGLHPVGTMWIKKAVGLPGQVVDVSPYQVNVGTQTYRISTTYITQKLKLADEAVKETWHLSDTELFMLGETITSYDSRFWGPIQKNHILGKAYAIL